MADDLRAQLLQLLAPHEPGDTLGGGRLRGASTELGLSLTFEFDDQDIVVELQLIADGPPPEHAAATEHFALSYRTHEARPVNERRGEALCQTLVPIVASNEARVLAELSARASTDRRRIRHVDVQSLLERAGTRARPYYTLSPYVGCLIGCQFCYAQSRTNVVRQLRGLPVAPWGSYVDVRQNAADVLARELRTLPPAPIKFCPIVADPYQPVEAKAGMTRACLEVLAEAGADFPVLLLTRSDLIVRDLELIASLPRSFVGVSLPTIDEDALAHFEPRAAPAAARLQVLRQAKAHGIETGVVIQPLLPGDPNALVRAVAEVASSASVDVLEGTYAAADAFADPHHAHAADPAWQREQAQAVRAGLLAAGVAPWRGELPPGF